MAPYQYQDYHNPYVGSITDLIRAPGEFRARAAELTGQAQARAAEVSGNAWAGAVQNIGQSVSSAVQQATDPRRKIEGVQAEAGAINLAETKKKIAEADTLQGLIKATPKVDLGGGVMGYDIPTLTDAIAAKGGDPKLVLDHVGPVNDALQQMHAGRIATVKAGALAIQAGGNDPVFAKDFLDLVEQNHVASPQTIAQFRAMATTPEGVAKITNYFAGPQKMERGAPGSMAVNPVTGLPIEGSTIPDKPVSVRPGSSLMNPQTGAVISTAPTAPPEVNPETARHNRELERIASLTVGRQEAANAETARHNRATEAHAAATDNAAPTLTPDAIQLTARQFAMTGQLPPMGMGATGAKVRTQIINAAAEQFKGLDLPTQIAAFKANQQSLTHTQGTLDNLTAFEKAAGKNIDTFIELTKNLPDTGVPWLNTPLRQLSDKGIGNQYLPAINAARQIASREVARVVNDPGLKGQLTDNARQGVEAMLSGDITIAQLKQVLPVLKSDMANVHASLADQLAAIQQRIATKPGETAPVTPIKTQPTIGERRLINGKVGEWDGKGWKAVP